MYKIIGYIILHKATLVHEFTQALYKINFSAHEGECCDVWGVSEFTFFSFHTKINLSYNLNHWTTAEALEPGFACRVVSEFPKFLKLKQKM